MKRLTTGEMISASLARIERFLYVSAAIAAVFGVWIYFTEADQRRLEVDVLRTSLLAQCLTLLGPEGPMSKLILYPKENRNYSWGITEDTIEKFASSCKEIEFFEQRSEEGLI